MDLTLWPILEKFPSLAALPRGEFRNRISPVDRLADQSADIWVKRDDLNAPQFGGNKVRALEWLLGDLAGGDVVATIGARGSTHALTTAVWARSVGAETRAGLWPQEMNDVARQVRRRLGEIAQVHELHTPIAGFPWLWWRRARGDRAIPAGGTSPLGILGHVNAGLELGRQIAAGILPSPSAIVVPLGTGGTMAGLALGLGIAGLSSRLVGARVVPRIIGRLGRVRRLADATRRLIERHENSRLRVRLPPLEIRHDVYGGSYGRPLVHPGLDRSQALRLRLDPSYSAKAFAAAMSLQVGGRILFWMTFDSRWLSGVTADG